MTQGGYRDRYYTLNKTYVKRVERFCAFIGLPCVTKYQRSRVKGVNGLITNVVQNHMVRRSYPIGSGMGRTIKCLVDNGLATIRMIPNNNALYDNCEIYRTQKLIDSMGDEAIAKMSGITADEVASSRTKGTLREQ